MIDDLAHSAEFFVELPALHGGIFFALEMREHPLADIGAKGLGRHVLLTARRFYPSPRDFDLAPAAPSGKGMPKLLWIYIAGVALIAAGYVDFPLIAFHFQKSAVVSAAW